MDQVLWLPIKCNIVSGTSNQALPFTEVQDMPRYNKRRTYTTSNEVVISSELLNHCMLFYTLNSRRQIYTHRSLKFHHIL